MSANKSKCRQHLSQIFSIVGILLVSFAANANQHSVGDITIHYNALSTANIPAEVASQYKITRSNRTGMVNISVMKNDKAIEANIFGNGKNLAGQLKELAFKEIREEDSVYYIATFTFTNKETIQFDLQVQPERKGKLLPLQFKQQLYTE